MKNNLHLIFLKGEGWWTEKNCMTQEHDPQGYFLFLLFGLIANCIATDAGCAPGSC